MNSTIFIGLLFILFIACFTGLIKWVARSATKKDIIKLMIAFDKMETSNKALVDTRETISKRIIGIDKAGKKLLFIDHTRTGEQAHVLDLSLIKEANIIKRNNLFSKHTGSIIVECNYLDPAVQPVQLTFYDEYYDDAESLAQMEKKATCWHQTINIFKSKDAKKTWADQQRKDPAFIKK